MIVYIETNFVLEVALEQEQSSAANAIILLSETGKIKLAFPSFVLAESFERVRNEHSNRNNLHASLVKTLNQLQRSEPHKQIMFNLEPVISVLKDSHVRELDLLHSVFDKLLSVGECIEINVSGFRKALIYQNNLDLSPKDSIIYSTIIREL